MPILDIMGLPVVVNPEEPPGTLRLEEDGRGYPPEAHRSP